MATLTVMYIVLFDRELKSDFNRGQKVILILGTLGLDLITISLIKGLF